MAAWGDGYVTDVSYTAGFYRELTPNWLWLTAVLAGQRPPDLTQPFRWAELGCGNGLSGNVVAACHPNAEVWGFDFNPGHIETATHLARLAGLANAHFREASFADLAADDSLPMFDFIVVHGVFSWIAPAVRAQLLDVIGRRLKPGGLVYVSYNTPAGWDAMAPLQYFMRHLARGMTGRSDQIMPRVLDSIERMVEANAAFFRRNPELVNRLKNLRRADPRYVAHEYLNQHWVPMMFTEAAEHLAGVKCSFMASATLTDNYDYTSVPAPMLPLLAEAPDRATRECLRDFGAAQSFRRDVFRRGLTSMSSAEQLATLDTMRLLPVLPRPKEGFRFNSAIGEMQGNPDIYGPLLDRLYSTGSLSFAEARGIGAMSPRPPAQVLESLALLISSGLAHHALPDAVQEQARAGASGFNAAVSRLNSLGGDMAILAAPAIGSAVGAELLETYARPLLSGPQPPDEDALSTCMRGALHAADRSLLKNGEPVRDPDTERELLRETALRLTGEQWGIRQALGIYGEPAREA
jgi:SAM-dependent methyltransferase